MSVGSLDQLGFTAAGRQALKAYRYIAGIDLNAAALAARLFAGDQGRPRSQEVVAHYIARNGMVSDGIGWELDWLGFGMFRTGPRAFPPPDGGKGNFKPLGLFWFFFDP